MTKEYGKTYYLYIYTLTNKKGEWEKYQDEPVVNVGISTNPDKFLKDQQGLSRGKDVLVLLVKGTTEKKHLELINQIEELRTNKLWFKFEPLAVAIKRNCEKVGFKPYSLKRKQAATTNEPAEQIGQLPL